MTYPINSIKSIKENNMKKIYSIPTIQETPMNLCHAIAQATGVKSNEEIGIKYGGVDKSGSKDPDANRRNEVEWGNLW